MMNRISLLGSLLLVVLLLPIHPAIGQSDDGVDESLAQGDSAYAAFDNAVALRHYLVAYRADSTHFEVLTRLARTSNDMAQDHLADDQREAAKETFEQAIRYADKLLAHHPDRAEAYFFQAATRGNLALFAGGREKVELGRDVETHIQRALEVDPGHALAYLAYGMFKREVADLSWVQRNVARLLFGDVPGGTKEEAAALLRQAIAHDPTLTRAHFELAITLDQLGRQHAAIEAMQAALALPDITTADQRNRERAEVLLERWQ